MSLIGAVVSPTRDEYLLIFLPVQHVTSYPVVSDGIATFKSNSYGAKSIDLTNDIYKNYAEPLVNSPYAQKPYGLVAPYVQQADSLASDGLTRVDKTFPIIKQDTAQIKNTILDFAYAPVRIVFDGRDYLLDTYGQEYKKCGGDGYVAGGKALITSGLVVTSDTLAWLQSFLTEKSAQGKDFASQKYSQAQGYASHANKYANERSSDAGKFAQEKSEEAKNFMYMKGDQAKDAAKNAQSTAQQKANEAKEKATK